MTVRMTHPDHDGEFDAQPSQVPFLKDARWQVVPGQDDQGEQWPAELQRFEGQDQVRIRHPETESETVVAASAVPHLREKGWQVVDEQAEAEAGLEDKTVPELRELAKARGISPIPATKPELLAALSSEAADEQATEEQDQAEPAEPAAKEE
jgi:hypothetical protein